MLPNIYTTQQSEEAVMAKVKKPTNEQLIKLLVVHKGNCTEIAKAIGSKPRTVQNWVASIDARSDEELVEANIVTTRKNQRMQDEKRINTKALREWNRVNNALEAYMGSLDETFKTNNLSKCTKVFRSKKGTPVGILHLTDIHFNELVNLDQNQYNFDIASARLRHFTQKAMKHFKMEGCKHVLVAGTGDFMNSDRRLDELLNNHTNRSRATFLAVDILQQLILELNTQFNVTVSWINGNEGRVGKDCHHSSKLASDNYDEVIFMSLRKLFLGSKGVTFSLPTDPLEHIVDIHGQHILLVHGHNMEKDVGKAVVKVKSKYANRGIIVRYVLSGHIHEAYVSDQFSRGGSPVGDNAYSDKALNLAGRASQNYHIVFEDGSIDSVKVDLQEALEGGYPTDSELHSYNARSEEKAHTDVVVHKIVI